MYCRLYRVIQKELNTFRKLLLSSQVSQPLIFFLLKVVRIATTTGH